MITLMTLILLTTTFFPPPLVNPSNEVASNSDTHSVSALHESRKSDDPTVFKTFVLDFPNPDEKGKLKIDINRGFVEVAGHSGSDVIIEILNPTDADSKSNSGLKTQFSPRFDLDKKTADNSINLDEYNQSYALNVRVKVPYQTDLDLDTYYDGYLEVKNVSGNIKAHSQNCDIRLLGVSGAADVYSYNGNLIASFEKLAKEAQLDFESYNGSIDLKLPASLIATTAISAGTGSYKTAFDIERIPAGAELPTFFAKLANEPGKYQFGLVRGGGLPIRIECEKGSVQLRKSMTTKQD